MELKKFYNDIENILENTKHAVIATSNCDGVVSASLVCIVNDGLTIYVQTDKFEKAQNIMQNPSVALNIGSYYFKGVAKIIGAPKDNSWFLEKFKQKHPKSFENYTLISSEVLIKIELIEAKVWEYETEKSILKVNLKNGTTYKTNVAYNKKQ